MNFIIVERKENAYVLFDCKNKGMACATAYTIKQLVENNHKVLGAKFDPRFKAVIHTKQGNISSVNKVYDVSLTKRSLATFEKGIFPPKSPVIKEVVVPKNKRKKSLCCAELTQMEYKSSEYHSNCVETYRLSATTPAGFTQLKKIVKNSKIVDFSFLSMKERINGLIHEFNRRGFVSIEVKDPDLSCAKTQKFAASRVKVFAENDYENTSLSVIYASNDNYEPVLTNHRHIDPTDFKEYILGSCANGGDSVIGLSSFFRKLGNL